MVRKKNLLKLAVVIFIAFETLMFFLIHISRVDIESNLRYISIIGATVFAWLTLLIELITAKKENEKICNIISSATDGNFIRIAMLFTLVADYFMVALEDADNLSGVTVFLGTQLFIFLHIYINDKNVKIRSINLITRLILTVLFIIIAHIVLGEDADRMAIISVIYYANLCTNAIFAHRVEKSGIVLTIGLILFALCDINVGLTAMDTIYGGFPVGSLLYNLMNADVDLIWLFYIPSQTLIPLTLVIKNKN